MTSSPQQINQDTAKDHLQKIQARKNAFQMFHL